MTRTVFCRKYKKDLPGLTRPPMPGPKGQEIFENISAQAWQDWLSHQTRLINEKHLNLMDAETRKYLSDQMERFFNGEDVDAVEGFVPPSEK